ncbi:uncharacterized protein V6R79_013057, partial [Siganus canaliculatus]
FIHVGSNKHHRWIREAKDIPKREKTSMNRDEGAYTLWHTWDSVLENASVIGGVSFSTDWQLHIEQPGQVTSDEGYRK